MLNKKEEGGYVQASLFVDWKASQHSLLDIEKHMTEYTGACYLLRCKTPTFALCHRYMYACQ